MGPRAGEGPYVSEQELQKVFTSIEELRWAGTQGWSLEELRWAGPKGRDSQRESWVETQGASWS